MGIDPTVLEEIPDYNQYTIERQPDFLKKVCTEDGSLDYILQIEAQVDDSQKMLKRLFLYYGLLYNDYELSVKQYVLYIGGKKVAQMRRSLKHENVSFRFEVINLQKISYHNFIHSDKPEDVILAILCDFEEKSSEDMIETILIRLKKLAKDELDMGKYLKQLEVLSKLRKLQEKTITKINSMGLIYDLETDIRYLQGKAKGEAKGDKKATERTKKEFIVELFKRFPNLPMEEIAEMVKTPLESVARILNEYKERNK